MNTNINQFEKNGESPRCNCKCACSTPKEMLAKKAEEAKKAAGSASTPK